PTPFSNFDRHIVAAELPELEQLSDVVSIGRTEDQTGYLLITTWDAQRRAEVLAALEGVRMLADAPGLIIDVRPNSGGSEELAREIAACFIDEPLVYAMHRFRDPDAPGGWTEPQERVLMPRAEGARYRGPVVVLMGEACMSSNEAFLMMMAANERVWLVGQPSYGASGNPTAHELDNGVVVSLPSWQSMTADGVPFEGSGLEPDVLAMRDIDPETRSDWFIKVARRELEILKQRVREMEEGVR
ncbi:MAG: S41 family peptidase, partial [Planctomycetota bacterium]